MAFIKATGLIARAATPPSTARRMTLQRSIAPKCHSMLIACRAIYGLQAKKDQIGRHLDIQLFLHGRGDVDLGQNAKAAIAQRLVGASAGFGKSDS
jgi:hypothetical protein